MAKKPQKDAEIEERIHNEIVVDCYDEYERATGWHCYLQEQLQFPFTATCIAKRSISPLQVKDEVEILDLADEEECAKEIFVTIRWEKDGLAVPLSQVKPISDAEEETKQAVADWHYWVQMGYEF